MEQLTEAQVRAMVHEHYRRTGDLELHKQFAFGSVEALTALDEAHRIVWADNRGGSNEPVETTYKPFHY